MAERMLFQLPGDLIRKLQYLGIATAVDLGPFVSDAIRNYRGWAREPTASGATFAESVAVPISPADQIRLRDLAGRYKVPIEAMLPNILRDAAARLEQRKAIESISALGAFSRGVDQMVLQVGLSDFSPQDEVAEHIAGLIDAMSRLHVADGGNPLEIDKMMPMVITGLVVPRG